MNVGLGWLGVVVGAVGAIVTEEMAKSGRRIDARALLAGRRFDRLCAGATFVITLVLFGIALLKQVPFSPGQGLAVGLLIGGLFGAIEIMRTVWLSEYVSYIRQARLSVLASLFAGLAAVSVTYAAFASNPWEPLIGFSIGAAMAAIFHTCMQYLSGKELSVRTEAWALFSITIAASILISMRHFDATHLRVWWAMPILLATTVLVAQYIAVEIASLGRLKDNAGMSTFVAMLIGAAIVAGLTAIYSWRLYSVWELLYVTAVGVGVGALIAWLFAGFSREASGAGAMEAGAATVVLMLAFSVTAFKLWAGLGIGVGLIAAWVVAIPALSGLPASEERPKLLADAALWPLSFGLTILLFRLFVQEYRPDLRGSGLEIHYTLIGALLGAILPFVFLIGVLKLREATAGLAAIAAVGMTGLFSAASPLIVAMLWGDRSVLGFVFGLVAATAFMLLSRLAFGDIRYSIAPLVIGAQLVAIQFMAPVLEADTTRAVRIAILAVVVVLAVAWLGITSLLARRAR